MTEYPSRIECGDFLMEKLPATCENATQLFHVVDKNRDYLGAYLPWVPRIGQAEDEIEPLRMVERRDVPAYIIMQDGHLIGSIDAHAESVRDASIELGYWLDREYTGRGIMTRAARVLMGMLFERGMNRVVIMAAVDNTSSIGVATRLGFVREGVMRAALQIRNGEFRDLAVFSKLKSEWEKD